MAQASTVGGLLEPLTRCLDSESVRRLAEFQIAPEVQERLRELAERANDGELTVEERAEYEALTNAADFVSILKLQARQQSIAGGGADL